MGIFVWEMGKEKVKLYHIAVTASDSVSVASIVVDKTESDKNSCERIVEDTVKDSSHRRLKEGMTVSYEYSDTARVGVFWSTDTNALYTAIAGSSATNSWLKNLVTDLHSNFSAAVSTSQIDRASAGSLSKEFAKSTEKTVSMCQNDPSFVSQAARVQQTLGEVRDITLENISQQLERSQNIDDVNAKSDDLLNFSTQFRKDSKEARCKAIRNCVLMYLLGFLIVAILVVVLLAVLGVFND